MAGLQSFELLELFTLMDKHGFAVNDCHRSDLAPLKP